MSIKNVSSQTAKILAKIIFAIIFGVMFWWFLEYFQLDIVNYKFSCCERCGNILYDREQPILAVCAGLSFLILAFLKIKDWKIFLITIVVTFYCFFPYWFLTYWSGHPRQECTALNYPRGNFPLINEFSMLVISGFWASICSAALIIIHGIKLILNSKKASEEIL